MKGGAAWAGLIVAILGWTSLSYASQPDASLREEILLRHFLLNAAICFPTGPVFGLIAEQLLGRVLEVTGLVGAAFESAIALVSGYLQWVVGVPRLMRAWRSRGRPPQ